MHERATNILPVFKRLCRRNSLRLIGAGAFLAFGSGFEGMLAVRRLRAGWWELNEEGTILEGTRSGATVRLGDPIAVRVGSIDAVRGRVDLEPG